MNVNEPPKRALLESRALDERGTATVEYVGILVLVAVLCVAAIVGLGPPLARAFSAQVTWLLLPFP